jgi:hypothetical protein
MIDPHDVPAAGPESLFDGEPIPLTARVPIPAFPVGALPNRIGAMVTAVSEFTQTDPAMAGTSALSSLSACTGGRVVIEVRTGWREPLHTYTATVAHPGERKSSVQQFMVFPILDTERDLLAATNGARTEAITRKDIATLEAATLKTAAAKTEGKTDKDDAVRAAVSAARAADLIEVPPAVRLVADDATPEAASSLLAEQGGRLAIISAEGGIFDIIAGRYSGNVPNMDLWLKGHSGDMLKIDRKNREPECIPTPALTLGLMIQPAVLDAIAAITAFRGRGLLARFLYAFPVSKVGRRAIAPEPIPAAVVTSYNKTVAALARDLYHLGDKRAVLTLSGVAAEAMANIERAVEPQLCSDGELGSLRDWGTKYVGAVARIAGILHMGEHGASKGPATPVNAVTVLHAHRIGEYFKACAINAFADMGGDQGTADAVYLWERVERAGVSEVSERDMLRAAQKFSTVAELRPAVDHLVDRGYLAPLPAPAVSLVGGRPPSPRFAVWRPPDRTDTTDTTIPR